jgi:PAS domain S-box-containing protein
MLERDTLRFTYVNAGATAQLGYDRAELLAMTPLHIKPEFSEAEFRALIDGLAPGQSHNYITLHRRKDGPEIEVEAVLQYPAGDVMGGSGWMVSIARDLTARREMEQRPALGFDPTVRFDGPVQLPHLASPWQPARPAVLILGALDEHRIEGVV